MSQPAYVLKATDGPRIAKCLTQREKDAATYSGQVGEFLESVGTTSAYGYNGFDGSRSVTGYRIPAGAEPAEGWRRDSKNRNLAVPAKKTPEGKRIVKEVLSKLQLAGLDIPDAPWSISSGNFRHWGRIQAVGDDYFLVYTGAPDKGEKATWGPLWEPVRLSEYHAALEAADAAQAVNA